MKKLTKKELIELIAPVIKAANEKALQVARMEEDCGTCNFDSPIMKLARWTDADVKLLEEKSGVYARKWCDGFIHLGHGIGQGERRTTWAETMTAELKKCDALVEASNGMIYTDYVMD